MSLQDWMNLGAALAILMGGVYMSTLERVVRRQHEQLMRLTRRVWVLEGSPHCECQDCEVEA